MKTGAKLGMEKSKQKKKKQLIDEDSDEGSEEYLKSDDNTSDHKNVADDQEEEEDDDDGLEIDIEKLLQRGELEMKEKETLIENRIKQFEEEKL